MPRYVACGVAVLGVLVVATLDCNPPTTKEDAVGQVDGDLN
jgi:hypothetical protein